MLTLVDTHFHYDGQCTPGEFMHELPEEFDFRLLAVGGDYAGSLVAQKLAVGCPEKVAFACGVHPHEAESDFEKLKEFAIFRDSPALAAMGELGLDYFYDYAPRRRQREVFEYFLALALEWDLPAVVHCRDADERFDAYKDALDMVKDFATSGGRFVVHCFAGTPAWAEEFLTLGGYLGVTGLVTFKKAENIRDVVRMTPVERLLLETDAPYLAPVPYRGRENHPKYLPLIAAKVAEVQGVTMTEVAAQTTANARRLFTKASIF